MNLYQIVVGFFAVSIFAETSYLTVMKLRQRTLKVARGSILLDTCSLMDGRIVDVAKTGIITAELIIPRSVIHEMQLLADKSDHDKRARARKGLDNVRELQKLESVSVTIINDGLAEEGGVDERLLNLARKYDASICTTDYNLNKVARVIGVTVINVNELAQRLRLKFIPGEHIEVRITQTGANRNQGVGYLDDGTMIVVEDAKEFIDQKVKVEITRSFQTEAGRMMFAKLVKSSPSKPSKNNGARGGRRTNNQSRPADNQKSRIKAAPAFHSDQLQTTSPSARRTVNQSSASHTGSSARHRSAASVEDEVVRLANK